MSGPDLSHFGEKRGVVPIKTPWGRWWQTVYEINIEIDLPPNTRAKNCAITIKPTFIECIIQGKTVLKGTLFGTIRSDDNVWSMEGGVLTIVLTRVDAAIREAVWTALFKDGPDGTYEIDAYTLLETRKYLDLERFQLENPGFDFSRAELSKKYDRIPYPPPGNDDVSSEKSEHTEGASTDSAEK